MRDGLPRVVLYTDGSAKVLGPNGDINGGWAYVICWCGHQISNSGSETYTTNNRMELKAIVEGLRQLNTQCVVDLYSDSQYALSMVTNLKTKWSAQEPDQWRTSSGNVPINLDIITDLYESMKKYHHRVYTHWVKGHLPVAFGGHELNAKCDELAYAAMAELCKLQNRPLKPRVEKDDMWKLKKIFFKKKKRKKFWKRKHVRDDQMRAPSFDSDDLW